MSICKPYLNRQDWKGSEVSPGDSIKYFLQWSRKGQRNGEDVKLPIYKFMDPGQILRIHKNISTGDFVRWLQKQSTYIEDAIQWGVAEHFIDPKGFRNGKYKDDCDAPNITVASKIVASGRDCRLLLCHKIPKEPKNPFPVITIHQINHLAVLEEVPIKDRFEFHIYYADATPNKGRFRTGGTYCYAGKVERVIPLISVDIHGKWYKHERRNYRG